MHRLRNCRTVASLAAALLCAAPSAAIGQFRRSGPTRDEAPAPRPAVGIPKGSGSPRTPFAGVWDGSVTLRNGPGANRGRPVTMVIAVEDMTTRHYSGATILPNDTRALHLATVVDGREMRWKQQNSGGGFWEYSARLVTRDSIAGAVVLRDWPQLPAGEQEPVGTFVLTRRQEKGR